MTKKHFIKVASILNNINDKSLRNMIALEFVAMFKEVNPRFDDAKFLRAVNMENK